ncbi:cupin domain-containing protein [Photobacterium sanctipauli]|uniref:Cupin domain-containing protein n=1 Tax=Photobacterium sanctipauli TaxID=1342794 RepID=A0A2T3NW10_9GAMM|nr:helix-turn-helix domain-containing protein [Photobacterium sanctipauli]PSW20470.1 cupin domain-containing protein [Photobacterium sanctipauli]
MSHQILSKQLPKGEPVCIDTIGSGSSAFSHPHRHDYYEIVWALEGEGTHNIDFVQYPLNQGQVYFISPGQVHSDAQTNGKVCFITFQPDFIEHNYRGQLTIDRTFYHNKTSASMVNLDQQGETDLTHITQIMARALNEKDPDWDLVGSMLSGFLHYSQRYIPQEQQTQSLIQQRMYALYVLIDNHYADEKKTDFYAKHLSVSNKRANEIARQHCGKTISRLVHDRVMLEARRDLAFTTKTVKQIAHDLGYDDVAYFCRFFRKMADESPLDFRQRVFK